MTPVNKTIFSILGITLGYNAVLTLSREWTKGDQSKLKYLYSELEESVSHRSESKVLFNSYTQKVQDMYLITDPIRLEQAKSELHILETQLVKRLTKSEVEILDQIKKLTKDIAIKKIKSTRFNVTLLGALGIFVGYNLLNS